MNDEGLSLDASRCALIIQDLQNDVIIEGGAFADSGSPEHAKEQNVVENVAALADTCRSKGIPVIHVWYIVEKGAPGLKQNAPLFEGVAAGALVRGTWGGEDWHTLYIPSSTSLYSIRTIVGPRHEPYMG